MKGKKKRKRVRTRTWSEDDATFSHDRLKHLQGDKLTDAELAAEVASPDVTPNAVVASVSGAWAFVHMDGREELCRIGESLMLGRASVLASGDDVEVSLEEDQLFVRGLAPRRTKLSRPAVRQSRVQEQVIAANVDTLVIVASAAKPAFKPGLVDRYLIAAQVGGVDPVLCVNKMDLIKEEPAEVVNYREFELPVLNTSCITGEGIDELREMLRGKLSVFAGHSGVGKSSLLNRLDPELDLDTQEVSTYNEKGRHTTTTSRLHELDGGIRVIDTPGIRRLGVWGVSHEELGFFFPEMESLAPACQFRDCTHIHEPGCAVRAAVDNGDIPRLRYGSYCRIRESL